MSTVSVMESDSVTLNTGVTEISEGDDVLWKYGAENSQIAKIKKKKQILFVYNATDERFRDRLKLDDQTGSLTITNITTQHAGIYKVEITGSNLTSKTLNVSVYGERSFVEMFTYSIYIVHSLFILYFEMADTFSDC